MIEQIDAHNKAFKIWNWFHFEGLLRFHYITYIWRKYIFLLASSISNTFRLMFFMTKCRKSSNLVVWNFLLFKKATPQKYTKMCKAQNLNSFPKQKHQQLTLLRELYLSSHESLSIKPTIDTAFNIENESDIEKISLHFFERYWRT